MALEDDVKMLVHAYLAGFIGATGAPFLVADLIRGYRNKGPEKYTILATCSRFLSKSEDLYKKSRTYARCVSSELISPTLGITLGVVTGTVIAPTAWPIVAAFQFSRLACESYVFGIETDGSSQKDATIGDYKTLRLESEASKEEVRKAYHSLAKTCHPDLHPGDKNAEEQFKKITEAYGRLTG